MGEEKVRINRIGNPVWAVYWMDNYLLVGDWSETLSFYNASGQQVMRERPLGKPEDCYLYSTFSLVQSHFHLLQRIFLQNLTTLITSLFSTED